MPDLDSILNDRPQFDLDELVDVANSLLGRYLPADVADARIKGEVNPRLVRHYTSEGMLESPIRQGREARYTADHLLQLLALRRLLADGVSASTIGESLRKSDRSTLQIIIEHGSEVDAFKPSISAQAALGAIDRIRARAKGGAGMRNEPRSASVVSSHRLQAEPPSIPTSAAPNPTNWDHYTLLEGVELRVRSDVKVPTSPDAQDRLLDHITRLLIQIAQRRMK